MKKKQAFSKDEYSFTLSSFTLGNMCGVTAKEIYRDLILPRFGQEKSALLLNAVCKELGFTSLT